MADEQTYERPTYASLSTPPRPAPVETRRRSFIPWVIAAMAIAFAAGLLGSPWFEDNVRSRIPGLARPLTPDGNAAEIKALAARITALETEQRRRPAVVPAEATMSSSATTEAKLDELNQGIAGVAAKVDATAERADAALSSANEGAERAQTLLLIATTRHALEAGTSLAALEAPLRAAFPAQKPAVDAVIAGSMPPVTLARLRADFLRLQPATPKPATSWLGSIRQGLGDVVEIRRADSPAAAGLTGRPLAAQRIVAGDVAGTIAALGPSANPLWLAEARRYLAAQRGLAALEAATVAKAATPVPSAG